MSNIKEGDLVQVVRWPCCGAGLGVTFVVGRADLAWGTLCSNCGARHGPRVIAWRVPEEQIAGRLCAAPISWLKRIPPLAELDNVQTKERIEV